MAATGTARSPTASDPAGKTAKKVHTQIASVTEAICIEGGNDLDQPCMMNRDWP